MAGGFGIDMFTNLIGGKPTIPSWNNINLGDQQTAAINQNLASLPALENLGSQVNQFGADQIQKLLEQVIPGYNQMVSGITGNIQSELKGEVPTDVSSAIQDSAAARSLSGGFGGTGLAGKLTARDLGITSLDLTQKGLSSAESWINQMNNIAQPSRFNLASMFVTPQQQFEDTFQNQEAQFQDQYAKNMNDFNYSFRQAAAKDFNSTANTVLSLAESYMGGMAGGGGSKTDLSGGDNGSTGAASFGGFN